MSTPSALSSPSTLMEKVRPEIRTKIFREAVRTEHRLVELGGIRVSSKIRERGTYTKLENPLFAVCRKISDEAQEALFDVNTIRVYCPAEIKQLTPSLPTITISDDIKPSKTQPTTVRERFRALSSNVRIRCIDIGVFEIHHAGALELFYEDTALRRLLPPVRDLAAKYELEELDGILGANRETLPHGEHVNHIRNAICLQEYECLQSQHDATADKVAVQMPRVTLTHAVPLRTELFSDDLKLIDVTEREHGSEALEWSSEFLSLNLCDRR